DVATGNVEKTFKAHGGAVTSVAFTPKGDQLVTAGADKLVQVWDPAKGTALRKMDAGAAVASLALSKDGAQAVSAAGKNVTRWNLADGKNLGTFATPAEVKGVGISPDGTR